MTPVDVVLSIVVLLIIGFIVGLNTNFKDQRNEIQELKQKIEDNDRTMGTIVREFGRSFDTVVERFSCDEKTIDLVLKAMRYHKMIEYVAVRYKPGDELPKV